MHVTRNGSNEYVELNQQNPQCWVPEASLQTDEWFLVQTHWLPGVTGSEDLDQVVAYRAGNGICGVITSRDGWTGSHDDYPYMCQLNDDRVGGTGETVRGHLPMVRSFVKKICVGVYNTNARTPLTQDLSLAAAVTLPGHPPIVVRPTGIRTSGCAMMQIVFRPQGIEVLHDVCEVDALAWPSSLEALTAYWNNAMWGQGK